MMMVAAMLSGRLNTPSGCMYPWHRPFERIAPAEEDARQIRTEERMEQEEDGEAGDDQAHCPSQPFEQRNHQSRSQHQFIRLYFARAVKEPLSVKDNHVGARHQTQHDKHPVIPTHAWLFLVAD